MLWMGCVCVCVVWLVLPPAVSRCASGCGFCAAGFHGDGSGPSSETRLGSADSSSWPPSSSAQHGCSENTQAHTHTHHTGSNHCDHHISCSCRGLAHLLLTKALPLMLAVVLFPERSWISSSLFSFIRPEDDLKGVDLLCV